MHHSMRACVEIHWLCRRPMRWFTVGKTGVFYRKHLSSMPVLRLPFVGTEAKGRMKEKMRLREFLILDFLRFLPGRVRHFFWRSRPLVSSSSSFLFCARFWLGFASLEWSASLLLSVIPAYIGPSTGWLRQRRRNAQDLLMKHPRKKKRRKQ